MRTVRSTCRPAVVASLLGIVVAASSAAALRPDTPVFPISNCTGCGEQHPFVAQQPGGGAVAWEVGSPFAGFWARRVDSTGLPVGSPIHLSFHRSAAGPLDVGPDGMPWATFATTDGLPNELHFSEVANDRFGYSVRGDAETPDFEPGGVVALGGSNVMASFEDLGSDGTSRQWVWRLKMPPAGQPHQVSSTEGLGHPRICPRPDGSFVVAWRTLAGSSYGVSYSLRGPNGEELRPATSLASNLTAEPNHALACARDGRFAIAWESSVHPGAVRSDVVLQRFDRQARRVRRLDVAHAATAGDQTSPSIAFDPGGALLAAFQSIAGGQQRIFARRFAVNGAPEGKEVRVDAGSAPVGEAGPGHPGIAAVGTSGRVLVVWSEDHSIAGRRLRR